MKEFLYYIVIQFLLVLTACNEDDITPDMQGEVNNSLIEKLMSGHSATFDKTGLKLFEKSDNGDWEEVDVHGLDGWGSVFENVLSFQDGKIWSRIKLSSFSMGAYPVYPVWKVYCEATGESRALYLALEFDYDKANKCIVTDKYKYGVIEFTKKSLVLSHDSATREIDTFKKTETIIHSSDNVLSFPSEIACYRYIVEKARGYFGQYVHYGTEVINLDEVEEWIEYMASKN